MKKSFSLPRWPLPIALLVFALVLCTSCQQNSSTEQSTAQDASIVSEQSEASNTSSASPLAASPAATPLVAAKTPSTIELGREIDRAIDEGPFAGARWGVLVSSLRDGRLLYAREANRLFMPASNMKLYSTAAALALLGPEWRWRTSVYAAAAPDASGNINGDLTLYGRGAPDLTASEEGATRSSLATLTDELVKRGVRHVRGDLVGDESYLSGDSLGDGWLWNDVQWYFGAEVSALSVNGNEADLIITPATDINSAPTVEMKDGGETRVVNETKSVERGEPLTIGVSRDLAANEVKIWGGFPIKGRPYSVRLAVHHPALWAAKFFRQALGERGITVDGATRMSDARVREKFDPAAQTELASISSRTLGEIVRLTNKESLNLNAELMLRTVGKEKSGLLVKEPGEGDKKSARPKSEPDEIQKGIAVLKTWLKGGGVVADNLAIHDGSGLSRLDLVTPYATAQLLALMARDPSAAVFHDSLPVLGRDGTLRGRLRGTKAEGQVSAKTGTMTYVNALSGYATTAGGEKIVFSIICNDEIARGSSVPVFDRILEALVGYRENSLR